MLVRLIITALTGLSLLAAAAPASYEKNMRGDIGLMPSARGLRHRTREQKRASVINQQTIIEPQITIVEQNSGIINQLAQIAEQELAQLVQAQVALVTELIQVMNNIRINHFRAKFSQVNTVIVIVTNIVDARDSKNINKRYLMNQLVADNGFPDSQLVIMVTQKQELYVGATPTNPAELLVPQASAVSSPAGAPAISNLDPNAPFGQLNASQILPYNTTAPRNALVLEDPANIIFADQSNLFVESFQGFRSDCAQFGDSASSLINLAAAQIFASIEEASAAQLASLQLGVAIPNIPPSVLAKNPGLAAQAAATAGSASTSAGPKAV